MRAWRRLLITLLALALVSSSLWSADLHWLFWDIERISNQMDQSASTQETSSQKESQDLQMTSSAEVQTEPEMPSETLPGETLGDDLGVAVEEADGNAAVQAALEAIDDMVFAYELKDEALTVVTAQYKAEVADYNKLASDYNRLAKKNDPFKLFILPEVTYAFNEGGNVWGAGLTLGAAYDNLMVAVGVDKKITGLDCFGQLDGYELRMGVGLIF